MALDDSESDDEEGEEEEEGTDMESDLEEKKEDGKHTIYLFLAKGFALLYINKHI